MLQKFLFIALTMSIFTACGNHAPGNDLPLNDSTNLDSFVYEPLKDTMILDSANMYKMANDSTDSTGLILKKRLLADSSIQLPNNTKDELDQALEYMKTKQKN